MLEMVNWTMRRHLFIQDGICYYIDILDDEENYESWITREGYGVSSIMFGCPKQQRDGILTFDDFRSMVIDNLPEYIESYEEDYPENEGMWQ